MLFKLDVPDYRLDEHVSEHRSENMNELTSYELWVIDMELEGKWVPQYGEKIYVPYSDEIGCYEEEWDGNIGQKEYVESGVIYPTANEAIERSRNDLEVSKCEKLSATA